MEISKIFAIRDTSFFDSEPCDRAQLRFCIIWRSLARWPQWYILHCAIIYMVTQSFFRPSRDHVTDTRRFTMNRNSWFVFIWAYTTLSCNLHGGPFLQTFLLELMQRIMKMCMKMHYFHLGSVVFFKGIQERLSFNVHRGDKKADTVEPLLRHWETSQNAANLSFKRGGRSWGVYSK